MGFPINDKENERRRAILPDEVKSLSALGKLAVQQGYGDVLGIDDQEYEAAGARIAGFDEVLRCDSASNDTLADISYHVSS